MSINTSGIFRRQPPANEANGWLAALAGSIIGDAPPLIAMALGGLRTF